MGRFHLSKAKLIMGFVFMLGLFFLQEERAAYAITAGPVTVATVDYEEEEIVINNNGNLRIYFASEMDAGKGNWEMIPADLNSEDQTRLDFSWVMNTMDNVIKIMGANDRTNTQARIVLPKRTTKLEISINYTNISSLEETDTIESLLSLITNAGTVAAPITHNDLEWKKGESGKWKEFSELTVAQLEKYQIKGADLYFRIKALNDVTRGTGGNPIYPDGTKGRRASIEVRLRIAKKASAGTVGIDGSKFTAEINYGKEYRVATRSDETDWIKMTDRSIKKLEFREIVRGLYSNPIDLPDGISRPFPEMILEVREYATAKSAASRSNEIMLNEQRYLDPDRLVSGPAPKNTGSDNQNIYISYTGDKNMVVTIPSASADNPYEYCIMKPDAQLTVENLSKTIWTTITKATEVKILKSKAMEGGNLYIRMKEKKNRLVNSTNTTSTEIASTVIHYQINYPAVPVVQKGSYTFVKDMTISSNLISFDIQLNTSGKDAYETEIRSIKLGTKEISFTSTVSPTISGSNPFDPDSTYTMTVTLDRNSLQITPNCNKKALTITFMNGTVDKSSVLLTVKNPTKAVVLSATASKGGSGATKINVSTPLGRGNAYCYMYSNVSLTDKIYVENTIKDYLPGAFPYTPGNDISVVLSNPSYAYVIILEYNTETGHIVKYKCFQMTSELVG